MRGLRAGLLLICAFSALSLPSDRVPLARAPAAAAGLVIDKPAANRSGAPAANPGRTPVAGPVPKIEPLAHHANRPYRQAGREYRPMKDLQPFRQRGMASWYGSNFHGRETAVGERYDMNSMSAAHPTLPLPSYVKVTTLKSRKSVIVRVNDRGPFAHDRVIDLSHAAARHLGILEEGTAAVELHLIVPDSAAKKMPAGDAGMQ